MDTEKLELTVTDEHGIATLADKVVVLYNTICERQNEADELMQNFRKEVLNAMIVNNIQKAKVHNLTFSLVIPSDTIEFNAQSFMINEPEDIVAMFTDVETTEVFDVERFKAENPEVYKKYTTVTDTPVVNVKKLEKTLPPIYKKYTKEIKSDKPIRLMIKEGKK